MASLSTRPVIPQVVADSVGRSDSEASLSESNDLHEHGEGEISGSDAEGRAVGEMCSPRRDPSRCPVHFYIHVHDGEQSIYTPCKRNITIDSEFQAQLQQNQEDDINNFLTLSEIIPTRKRQRHQPLLDFTRSKILTSQAYTKGCERLLAQRQARESEARCKAEEREATKE